MPSASFRLIERDLELNVLTERARDAMSGRGSSACVLGPAGQGKTTLVRALAEVAAAEGVRVWTTSAGQLESQIPFGVLRRLFDRPVRRLTSAERDALEATPARLALSQLWQTGHDAERFEPPAQGDLLHSLRWLLEEFASAEPTLLIVDDAQWADEESLLFFGSLRELLVELPITVVVAARDESVDRVPSLSALVADRDGTVLRLAPLTHEGVAEFLHERGDDAAAAAVLDVTGGNPFLVRALLDTLSGDVTAEAVHAAVPDTVVDLMVARLAALPEAERALARAVAVLDSAPLHTAATLAGIDGAASAADHLRRAGLFAEGQGVAFRHALLRSAVYAIIGTDTRDALHRSAAEILRDDVASAAAHLLATTGIGDQDSVRTLRQAASNALAQGSPQSCVVLLKRAIAEPPPADLLPDLLMDLGTAQIRMFDTDCVSTLQQGLDLVADPVKRAPFALALANAISYAGGHAPAAELLNEARLAITGADRELELTVEAAWAAVGLLVPDQVQAVRTQLRSHPDLAGETPGERRVLTQLMTVAAATNQPAAVIRTYSGRVIGDWGTAEQFPEYGDWVWPRLFLGQIGEFETVRRLTDEGIEGAAERGSVAGVLTASFVRAFSETHAGNLFEAEHYYLNMLGPDLGDRGLFVETLAYGGLGHVYALQGRIPDALAALERFPEIAAPGTPVTGTAMIDVGRSVVRRALGDNEGALSAAARVASMREGLDIDSPMWVSWRTLMVDPLRALGREDEARAMAAEQLELCRISGVPHLLGEALSLNARVAVDSDEGISLARQAVEILEPTGSRLRWGAALLTLGSALRRNGDKAEARAPLQQAVTLLTECGAAPAADFARSELAATGVRISRANANALTPSERRVAELALAGFGNREIAAQLHVTRKTVETHLSAVYRKAAITRREDLTRAHLS